MDTDVLVVGAGPVGLMMAAELSRHGVQCRIIDKLVQPSPYCRAIGILPRTLEIWEQLGIVTEMIDGGIWLLGMRAFVNGREVQRVEMDVPDLPYGFLGLPQYDTERILAKHLATFGTFVERDVELRTFRQTDEGVTVTLAKANGGTETLLCHYLVGCDGAHSTVRHGLGLSFEGDQYPLEFTLGDIEVRWKLPHGYGYRFLHMSEHQADDFLICIPLPERHRYRVTTIMPTDSAASRQAAALEHGVVTDRPAPTLADLQASVDRLAPAGTMLHDLRWSSIFRISHRIVPQYSVGRVFIAGDAAHIHPPTGGQGMNTGIQDAYNLAWKLALVIHGSADAQLLDSYNAERLPVGQAVVARTHARTMAMVQDQGDAEDDDRAELMQDSQLLLNYRGSAWVGEDLAMPDALSKGPQPGDRAPDVGGLRRTGVGRLLHLFELLRGTAHTLLLYLNNAADHPLIGQDARRLAELAAALRASYGNDLRIYGITALGAPAVTTAGLPMVEDTEGGFRRLYDVADMSAYLVRPDGYVGYRAYPLQLERLRAYLRRILHEPSAG
jgi:2-polyprenyl-6-methoxyphenol hydroxylase-like FAD-dependent oxidoreductase